MSRWESRVVGLTESPLTQRVVPIERDEIIREYWVKSTDGQWYRVRRPEAGTA